jgi:hypothetical protein
VVWGGWAPWNLAGELPRKLLPVDEAETDSSFLFYILSSSSPIVTSMSIWTSCRVVQLKHLRT